MRKAQKQQAQELARQMEEAHNQIKKQIEQGNFQPAMALLEECRNAGIALGTLIESTEGEGHPTVAVLEEYCELVYRLHEGLSADSGSAADKINSDKIYKLLKQKLIKVTNSLKHDVAVRREAVFLPYKASMWDSLESVWKAADEDPDCDAYVIPIPYYDKNPDGSFREMHYEGEQYPDDVPITRYNEFDFGAHHPDMIFIHNPYDDTNLVTSVHPFFYSDKLRKVTDTLIYIPYFVLGEISPEDEAAIERMKHFCTVPGVYHADKVIVQSEEMKQVYIKVLLDAAGSHTEVARNYWENRILGLGSPKLDKVSATRREELEIPREWLRVIQKPDGEWKKIILYNTSVGALLAHNEKMLEKIEDVLQVFKENQADIALLWRPHPLIKATLESMRPQLRGKYDRIVRNYREEGWGIYDDSADLNRAIALSDAYYGDGSSVVQLCVRAGMPVMLEDVEIQAV
ncbi:MAG: CDP-glycerol glycerophosphotransferase family protein [Roseburia sp.]|nr:CDP-glycerol glycerophosphotransferase family protein [Roseburia sp.]